MRRLFIAAMLLMFWLVLPPSVIKPKTIYLPFNRTVSVMREPAWGLDLQGGSRLVFLVDTKKISTGDVKDAVQAARDIIERRVNFFGVSEPNISVLQRANTYTVVVELPGVAKPEEAARLIGQTAQLSFREYKEQVFIETKLTGAYLKRARLEYDQQTGKPVVGLTFNTEGARLFGEITKRNLKKPLAIFLDNQLVTSPVVQQEITTGTAVISGSFTVDEAKQLVSALNAGALPAPVRLIEQSSIEPTVGQDNVRRSVLAGLVGIASVAIYMVAIYRKNGLYALISLTLYALMSIFLYEYTGIVLTLSGIAGLLLSIGMALDANILIYERIKEEEREQKDARLAMRIGFDKALGAIREANINTLLIAFILFNPLNLDFLPLFGSVRGFAATLTIGVLLSLFTGVVVTKNVLWWAYNIDGRRTS